MPDKDNPRARCPECKGSMSVLKRIVHDDSSATVYLRCPHCSHLEVVEPPRPGHRGEAAL